MALLVVYFRESKHPDRGNYWHDVVCVLTGRMGRKKPNRILLERVQMRLAPPLLELQARLALRADAIGMTLAELAEGVRALKAQLGFPHPTNS
jgi:hypothetical protein